MGGPSSGPRDGKNCTDEMRSFDIRELARAELLTPGTMFSWNFVRGRGTTGSVMFWVDLDQVIFNYRSPSSRSIATWSTPSSYSVALDWTPCPLGGQRAWWLCPGRDCGRRVALLYSGNVFACRRCHRLAYPSQRERDHDRLARRADSIRDRLGWEPGMLNGRGSKPRGMHQKTFEMLSATHDSFVNSAVTAFLEHNPIKPR